MRSAWRLVLRIKILIGGIGFLAGWYCAQPSPEAAAKDAGTSNVTPACSGFWPYCEHGSRDPRFACDASVAPCDASVPCDPGDAGKRRLFLSNVNGYYIWECTHECNEAVNDYTLEEREFCASKYGDGPNKPPHAPKRCLQWSYTDPCENSASW
jgi:hypothetical protein